MKDSLSSGFALSALIHAALIPTASLLIAGTRPTTPIAEYRGFLDRHPQSRANAGTGT